MKPFSQNKKLLLVSLAAIVFFAGLAVTLGGRQANIDRPPVEGTELDYSTHARIVDGEELLQSIGGVEQYNRLARDLFVFAKAGYGEYKDSPEKVIGFRVVSEPKKDGDTVVFDGRFGSVNHKIEVRVKLLKNRQIRTSITDTKTKLNLDTELPSNNKRDQFIGFLPLQLDNYQIEYVESSDSFLLTIYDGVSKQAAEKALAEGLGASDLSTEKYTTITPVSAGEGVGFPGD